MELSETIVGSATQAARVTCEFCDHTALYYLNGFFIRWFGKRNEFCLPKEVECIKCLRDTRIDLEHC